MCTNSTPWSAWAAAPRARPEVLADHAASTFTEKARHGRSCAATWVAAVWRHSPTRACLALAGVHAQLTEVAGFVDPGDVYRPGRSPGEPGATAAVPDHQDHPSSLSSDERTLHQMKPVRRRAGQEHFRGRAGSESRGGPCGKCRTCQGSDLRRWVKLPAVFQSTAVARQMKLRPLHAAEQWLALSTGFVGVGCRP